MYKEEGTGARRRRRNKTHVPQQISNALLGKHSGIPSYQIYVTGSNMTGTICV
jgi:hypothetical protein